MRELDDILADKIEYKKEYKYLEKIHESYHGINMNVYTNNDIYEAVNTAAGIDGFLKLPA
jgi:hypothetical protein